MSTIQFPGSALLVATLIAAMGLAAMSPLPSTVAKAPLTATSTAASTVASK